MRVLDAAGRVRDRAKVGWSSSVAFATLGTSLTTLIALPLLTIAYDVLLGTDMASPDSARTGYTSALVAVMTSVAGGVVSAVVADRNLGIFQEIHSYRSVDVLYWLSSAVVPATLALVTAVAALASVGALSGQWRAGALMALPLAVVCGLLLGVAAGGVGVNLSDPYLGSTILVAVAPILAASLCRSGSRRPGCDGSPSRCRVVG